jgi:hypothetical protein
MYVIFLLCRAVFGNVRTLRKILRNYASKHLTTESFNFKFRPLAGKNSTYIYVRERDKQTTGWKIAVTLLGLEARIRRFSSVELA